MFNNQHIVIFSALFEPSVGGVENYTASLAETLSSMGFKVTVVTNNIFGLSDYDVDERGFRILRLPSVGLVGGRFPIPVINEKYNNIKKELYDDNVDAVIINTRFYPLSIFGASFAIHKSVTPIVIEHGSAYLTLGSKPIDLLIHVYEHFMTSLISRRGAKFYAVSAAGVKWLKTFGISASGIIHNSINVDDFISKSSNRDFRAELGIGNNEFVVCFIGRLVPEKGILSLCEASRILEQRNVNCKIIIAGSGYLENEVNRAVLEGKGMLKAVGSLAHEDVAALLLDSNLFCLPTRSEGFATSLLEASACGVPSLITRVGGVDELIPDEDYGLVLSSDSPIDSADEIERACKDPEKTKLLGFNAQQLVRGSYSWDHAAKQVIEACLLSA